METPAPDTNSRPTPTRAPEFDTDSMLSTETLSSLLPDLGDAASQISSGSLAGFATGVALRKIGKFAAFAAGSVFILLNTLSYTDYITINWHKIDSAYHKALDHDEDGVVTVNDLNAKFSQTVRVISHSIPTGIGFTAGMMYGMSTSLKLAGGTAALYGVGSRLLLKRAALTGGAGLASVGVPAYLAEVADHWGWAWGGDHDNNPDEVPPPELTTEEIEEAMARKFGVGIAEWDLTEVRAELKRRARESRAAERRVRKELEEIERRLKALHSVGEPGKGAEGQAVAHMVETLEKRRMKREEAWRREARVEAMEMKLLEERCEELKKQRKWWQL
mmetsp:Transcript_13662/g.34794  ORF Transcript_13662/g.34794 Transcript_13662/m.34794 type:complete len:333 (-) Transcript_13662:2111-3109(-)